MAKKVVVKPTREQYITAALKELNAFNSARVGYIPAPTREFEVGERVVLGNLSYVVVIDVLYGGKAYMVQAERHDRGVVSTVYLARWWFDLDKVKDTTGVPHLMSPHRPLPARAGDIHTMLHYVGRGGLVCDPRYQRGYVWNEANRDALIESVFDRLDIGAFLIVSHAGYNHEGDTSPRTYITLDGTPFQVERQDDYTNAIIDGQQRLTTLMNFIMNRRAYKGVLFSQMNRSDQMEFLGHSIMWRMVDEDNTTEKDVVRMFLQANRGVPQSPEHIVKVQALYDSM